MNLGNFWEYFKVNWCTLPCSNKSKLYNSHNETPCTFIDYQVVEVVIFLVKESGRQDTMRIKLHPKCFGIVSCLVLCCWLIHGQAKQQCILCTHLSSLFILFRFFQVQCWFDIQASVLVWLTFPSTTHKSKLLIYLFSTFLTLAVTQWWFNLVFH